jgi:dienelactone hydrolase
MPERGRFRPDMQYRCAMLARMGVTMFSYDMFAYSGEASLQIPFEAHRTPFALTMQLWNSIRVTDFLCSLETVDQSKIGATGASGGGTQTFLLAAVDQRITFSVPAVMVSAHFYGGCPCESGLPIHQTHCGLNTNNVEFAAMVAPRPQLLISIGGDWCKNTPVTEMPYLKKVYGFYNSAGNIENVHIPNEQHDYGYTKREALYNFVTRVCGIDTEKFKDAQGRYIEKDVTIESPDNLLVFGNGRVVKDYYVLQPVKTRPMMPATNIRGVEDLRKALYK